MMAVARTLLGEGDLTRNLYLFDTFDGMTEPTEYDVSADGVDAAELLKATPKSENRESLWCIAHEEAVREAMESTNYPKNRIHLVKGRVEETLPAKAPDRIALLRLDTDWYESTRHEMEHLYPRLEQGGVIIVDDYGHWKGARKAVDEYLARSGHALMLHRIDYTGRVGIRAL
jgi:O-methyltransferase